ncbi:MAG: rubredoxin [Gammaproteobacteria bacterium]
MKKWCRVVCGFACDENLGFPEEGKVPGTAQKGVPADWECPDCGVAKADFEMVVMA